MSVELLIGVLVAVLVALGQKWLSDRTRLLLMTQLEQERASRESERVELAADLECYRKRVIELRTHVFALEALAASKGATIAEISAASKGENP